MHTVGIIVLILIVLAIAIAIARVQYMKKGKLRLAWSSTNGGKPQVTFMSPAALGEYFKDRAKKLKEKVELITAADAATRIKLRFHWDDTGYLEIEISGSSEKIAIVMEHIANVFGIIKPTVAHD